MSTKRFHHGTPPTQLFFLPPALTDWIPADHEVYAWSEIVDALDLRPIYQAYASLRGQPPYDPGVMVKILVYGYARGLRSSRQLARACVEDLTFRILTGNLQPDFTTIAQFRRRHLQALGELLVESVRLAQEAGLVKGREVAIDGTKIQANASKHRAMSYGRMAEELERLEQEITEYLRTLEATDQAEDAAHGRTADGRSVPEALADAERRRATIQAAKARLEAEAQARAEAAHAERVARAEAAGKPAPPPPDEPPQPDPKAQSNFTDPDSRIMRNADKAFIQGYNAQVAVDVETQIILAADCTNQAADSPHLLPLLDHVTTHLGRAPQGVLADAGYCSDAHLEALETRGIDALIPPEKVRHRAWRSMRAPRGRIPRHLSRKDRMRRKLQTQAGRQRYRRRMTSVEPVFGILKGVHRCRQFLLRGLAQVRAEWRFHCAVHNLQKILRYGTGRWRRPAPVPCGA
jgi:transposase